MKLTKFILSVAVIAAPLFVSACSSQTADTSIPSDKKEIMDRFVAGTLDPSYVPALFFGHFGGDQKLGEGAVKA